MKQAQEWITDLAFSPRGDLLVSGSQHLHDERGGPWRVWDVKSGKLKADLSHQIASATAFAFMPDGETFAAADEKRLYIGAVATGKPIRVLKENLSNRISFLAVNPDNKDLICLSSAEWLGYSVLTFWELSSGRFQRTVTIPNFEAASLSLSPQGTLLAVAGQSRNSKSYSTRGEVRLWDMNAGKWTKTLMGNGQNCYAVAFSPVKNIVAGAVIASSEMFSGTGVHLWDASSGKLLRVLPQEGATLSLAFSNSGDTLVSSGSTWGIGMVRFWNPDDGKCRLTLTGRTDYLFATALSPDGKTLAASSLMDIFVGDLEHKPPKWNSLQRPMDSIAYGAGHLRLWDVNQQKTLREWSVFSASENPKGAEIKQSLRLLCCVVPLNPLH